MRAQARRVACGCGTPAVRFTFSAALMSFRRSPVLSRSAAVQRVQDRLQRDSFPRLQMSLIVAATGGFGLLTSYVTLQLGLTSMAVRYPLALGVAYLFFLFLLWVWLRAREADVDLGDLVDAADLVPTPRSAGASKGGPDIVSGGGGDFAGGGASGAFRAFAPVTPDHGGVGSSLSSVAGDAVDAVSDADEVAIPLVVIVFAVGIALASLYVIYAAPVLLAEVLVDSGVSYALVRRLPEADRPHWLASAFRRTVLPLVVTAVFVSVLGAVMASVVPGAVSIGQVMHPSVESVPAGQAHGQ